MSQFKKERKDLIRELKKVNFDLDKIDRSRFHLRGLEAFLSISYNKMMQNKRAEVLETVLAEQRSQKSRGVSDVDALRDACRDASAWARERAEDLGRRDAKAVATEPAKASESSMAWAHESTPSLCSTISSSSTSTRSSVSSDGSLDSLNYMANRGTQGGKLFQLEKVDELPHVPS